MTISDAPHLLRTGEAARLLGCSRQHVVDLCDRGVLPATTVGSHRRIRLQDVLSLAAGRAAEGLRREQARSRRLHVGVAGELVADPDRVIARALTNLERLLAEHPRGEAGQRLLEWQSVLGGPIDGIVEALTSSGDRFVELRQNSPFAGVLSAEQRTAILESFRAGPH